MQTETGKPVESESPDQTDFHHAKREGTAGECTCPIHRGKNGDPATAPFGMRFAQDLSVKRISRQRAGEIYRAHHAYMDDVPNRNLEHHAIEYRGETVSGITYRYPLLSRKRIYLSEDGNPIPEPRTKSDIRSALNPVLADTAINKLSLHRTTENDIDDVKVFIGDTIVEVARICIGVDMRNLASAALALSQERFVEGENCSENNFLLTFVRADYDATMVRALLDKGWRCVGWTRPSQAGNRENKEIRNHRKWTFLCPISTVKEQCELSQWVS